ncbi:NEDD4 family-interacting protein 1 isoform X3 [Procambarus clarkii]|uniref:NEDD4 family-interacting protein 1 isoform X3 n=1 Tax=Procambarus clarkii TaxID=6728 RepID=UPI001E672310|nr:NEDD4 family-interacting protein 1-like isoform X1 [Procambarus clarkii]
MTSSRWLLFTIPLSDEESSENMSSPTPNQRLEAAEAASAAPPPYSVTDENEGAVRTTMDDIPPPKPDMHAPPPYEESDTREGFTSSMAEPLTEESSEVQPPSYEEVQRLKALEAAEDFTLPLCHGSGSLGGANLTGTSGSGMRVLRVSSLGGLDPETAEIAEEQLLGTDFMFFVAFAAAFVFNWVGFVLLLCFCHTVAGRTGALAGFGLSLAKWAVIVRHSTDLVADSNTWLLWLIMALGMLICMRAILQYVHAKREWHQVPHNSRHRFFLFY